MPAASPAPAGPAEPARLFARDVAARVAAHTGQTCATATITQYLWIATAARTRARTGQPGRQPRAGDIPAPDGHARPPWRTSGPAYPYWNAGGPIGAWITAVQPPGKPRADGAPRRRRKKVYARPGRKRGRRPG